MAALEEKSVGEKYVKVVTVLPLRTMNICTKSFQ